MKKSMVIITLLITCINTTFSQVESISNKIIPPSPTVSELGKYGTIPVGHYTGIPQISIPLYHLQCGQLQLPISLSYYAGGIRVEQIASWVGLGWSLNAGGVINSNIMGASDFNSRINVKSFSDIEGNSYPSLTDMSHCSATPWSDSQPDIYSYNFLGYSGQFIMDNNFVPNEIRNNKVIKINCDRASRIFNIQADDGTNYIFSELELTTNSTRLYEYYINSNSFNEIPNLGAPANDLPTAWFLSKMISADKKDTIKFMYENERIVQNGRLNGKLEYNTDINLWEGNGDTKAVGYPPFSVTTTTNKTKRLKTIIANNGARIEFTNSETDRIDLPGSRQLNSIIVYSNGLIIKKWDFNYTNFISDISHQAYPALNINVDESQNSRLRLSSVIENDLAPYIFEYYGDLINEPKMPYRNSFSGIDYWGFCNSMVTVEDANNPKKLFSNINLAAQKLKVILNTHANPSCPDTNDTTKISINISFTAGSDKNPNENYAKIYTLKKITYPTKGTTIFDYELHDYSLIGDKSAGGNKSCGGLRIKSIQEQASNTVTRNYQYKMLTNNLKDITSQSSGSLISEFSPTTERWSENQFGYSNGNCGWTEKLTRWNMLELSSSSYTSMNSYGGDYIGYSFVSESDGNGSIRYHFYSINDFPNNYRSLFMALFYESQQQPILDKSIVGYLSKPEFPFLFGFWGKSYGRGLIQKKAIFNTDNKIVKLQEYLYDFMDRKQIFGMEVIERRNYLDYNANIYYHQIGQALLNKQIQTDYDLNGLNPLKTTSTYSYNSYNQISQEISTQSNGRSIMTKYIYPPDIDTSLNILKPMTEDYIISPVIKKEISVIDGASTSIIYAEYNQYSFKYFKLSSISKLETVSPISFGTNYSSNMKREWLYNYNNEGLLIKSQRTGGQVTSYLWGYRRQYPIAKIDIDIEGQVAYTSFEDDCNGSNWTVAGTKRNSDYSRTGTKSYELSSGNNITKKTFVANTSYTLSYWGRSGAATVAVTSSTTPITTTGATINGWTYYEHTFTPASTSSVLTISGSGKIIDELRLHPTGAMMTTYTYTPLVGISSETDSAGHTIYYEYDALGRLTTVKDQDGNIVKDYQYNYKQ